MFELLPEQERFIYSNKPIVAYYGGLGSGKTYISCVKAIMNVLRKRTQLMIGLTYSSCRDVILTTMIKVLDKMGLIENKHYKINKSQLDITFISGYKILIRSAEIGNKLRGLTVSDIFIDEFCYHKSIEVYLILLGRLRESSDGQMFLTSSPRGFNFSYDIAVSPNCEYIQVSTFKNTFLPDQYIKNMIKQYSSKFISQELYGEFVNLGGTIFDSNFMREDIHTINTHEYNNCKRIRFWDFAFSEDDGDYSAGVLLAKVGSKYVIEDIIRVRQTYSDLKKTIINTARSDGRDVLIGWEQAGQQKGIINDLNAVPELGMYQKRNLVVAKYGHKIKRILPLASLAENGNLFIHPTCKNKLDFYNEINSLTLTDDHAHDDMADSCASAFIMHNTIAQAAQGHKTNIY